MTLPRVECTLLDVLAESESAWGAGKRITGCYYRLLSTLNTVASAACCMAPQPRGCWSLPQLQRAAYHSSSTLLDSRRAEGTRQAAQNMYRL
jgi:hypothetical protein